jgi:hypothetical protein
MERKTERKNLLDGYVHCRIVALALFIGLALPSAALAQAVQQSGTVTPGDLATWQATGKIQDGGTSVAALQGGRIVMVPSPAWSNSPTQRTAWLFLTPPGITISCTATQSQCFAEMLTFAATQGLSVDIYCTGENKLGTGGSSVSPPLAYISSSVNITTIGALAQRYVHAHGCNITFTSGLTGTNFLLDTMLDGGSFRWEGQIVGTNNSPDDTTFPFGIAPTTCPPAEGCTATVSQDSEIYVAAVVQGTAAPSPPYVPHGGLVAINLSNGGVFEDNIEIGELNGCGPCNVVPPVAVAQDGVRIFGATASNGFVGGKLHVKRIHNTVNGIIDGTATNQTNYARHEIVLDACELASASGICIDEYGNNNHITVKDANNNSSGAYKTTIQFETASNFNSVDIFSAFGETTPPGIVDMGTGNSWKRNGMALQEWKGSTTSNIPGMQWNYLPIGSISGGAPVNNPTNSAGVFSTQGGTSVTLYFSPAFQRDAVCNFGTPADGQTLRVTTSDGNHVIATSSGTMPTGVQVSYLCHGAF